ncbi:MAG TPA: hypothetical protein PKJ26_00815 [Candidatus Woesebacteria bacterium]|nr:hypothetical protein [Candidatus Woesebacteria bacterium]HNS65018.1 hypothetical protein [Candidatus Woesebacteria bacterium]
MKLQQLQTAIQTPLFTSTQVGRLFVTENLDHVRTQLSRWVQRGLLIRHRRGLFQFTDRTVDEMVIAQWLYQPSYVSLESALSIHGLLLEVPQQVTSVTPTTTRRFTTPGGIFRYSKIRTALYFGYEVVTDTNSGLAYNLAQPAKAVLDYVYVRKLQSLDDSRLELDQFARDYSIFSRYLRLYPSWVQTVLGEVCKL